MGAWYWIGVSVGIGVALGVLLAGPLAGSRAGLTALLVLAVGAGIGVGYLLPHGGWTKAIGGAVGGLLGALGGAQIVAGTLRRGGSRFGTAMLVAAAAVLLAAIAWIPVAGYVEAALVPALAARLRGRTPERYAGLRSLARD